MDVELFDYELPQELIAQFPTKRRELSRLLVLDRRTGDTTHGRFADILHYLRPGDALVVNNTKVFKARLLGHRASGGQVEVFLVRRADGGQSEDWLALVRPSRRLSPGEAILFDNRPGLELVELQGDGVWKVRFNSPSARKRVIARHGHVPLPQYIKRDDQPSDIRRYQTVFAGSDKVGAVAAPTAGFHFTKGLLDRVHQAGVELIELTLHVGPGTFKPITADTVEGHTVDPEYAELSPHAAGRLNAVRGAGGSVFAVGTTSVRTLESARVIDGRVQPLAGMVDLYIKPGHEFRLVDHLITNFHLPKSSLLVLVSAFAGRDRILAAYQEAIERRYRFYSYGDAMLIL